jgi:hypothetical protein|tara:strand:+ start:480 stop:638 length:159 start_codon:yes stop_codon:yes gene_type:complete
MKSDKEIKEYCIVKAGYEDQLSLLVKEKLKEGWIPMGGVSANELKIYQAMVR